MAGERKQQKEKKTISRAQEWVICFKTYVAIVTMREPDRVKDLLAYASLRVMPGYTMIGFSAGKLQQNQGGRPKHLDAAIWQ